jgi:hypothetical protein
LNVPGGRASLGWGKNEKFQIFEKVGSLAGGYTLRTIQEPGVILTSKVRETPCGTSISPVEHACETFGP